MTVCNYWNNGNHSISEIFKITKINKDVISNYLQRGADIGYCNYTKEEAYKVGFEKINEYMYQNRTRPIKCVNTSQVFGSLSLCSRLSKELFGKDIHHSSIYKVLNDKQKSTKGFTFQYITREEFNTIKQQSPELAFGDFFILNERNN